MPIYEYECDNCGARFERFQSIRDEPIRQCPTCSGQVHKVLHPAGIIFKGSGWYITDSRKSASGAVTSESQAAGAEPKAASKSNDGESNAASKSSPTETKAETKSESTTAVK